MCVKYTHSKHVHTFITMHPALAIDYIQFKWIYIVDWTACSKYIKENVSLNNNSWLCSEPVFLHSCTVFAWNTNTDGLLNM